MKSKFLALFLISASSAFAARVFVGVGFGGGYAYPGYYPAPPPVAAYYAPAVRPGYSWIGGYYAPAGPRYAWHAGYYARPPYVGARWYAPRYYGGRYYGGYWRR